MNDREFLGPLCFDCWCMYCGYRPHCSTMEGNTDWYCKEQCKGEESTTCNCSQYEPIKKDWFINYFDRCPPHRKKIFDKRCQSNKENCKDCWLEWLQQEANSEP